MRYETGPLDHPVYGKANFSCDIPFLLPFRGYTREDLLPQLEECDRIAKELIDVGRVVWPDDEDEKVLTKLTEYAFICPIMANMRVTDPRLPYLVYAMVLFIAIDDQLDTNDCFDKVAGSLKELVDTIRETDPMFDRQLPSGTAQMARLVEQWDKLKAWLLEIPDYRTKYQPGLRQEIFQFMTSHVAQHDQKKKGTPFSESTTRELLRNICGVNIVIEYTAILRDAIIPDYVRKDVLFAVARNKVADVEILFNGLLGLEVDMAKNQIDSPIMMAVVEGKANLQEAIEQSYVELLDALHDLKISTDKLLEVYPDDENVKRFVNTQVSGMDGRSTHTSSLNDMASQRS